MFAARCFPATRSRPTPVTSPGAAWSTPTRHRREATTSGSTETWGRGKRFGIAPLGNGQIYWYATATTPSQSHQDDTLDDIRTRYTGWHQPIPALLAATHPETLLRHAIYSMKASLPRYHTGRIVLLDDAAHAMTPDIGQGGCQALEDAVTFVHLLSQHDIPAALAAFDHARRERTQKIVRTSAIWGTISEWRNPIAATIRNGLVSLLPPSVFLNASRQTLGWQPPPDGLTG